MYEVQCTKYEILWKYTRNRPSKLGEIGNSGAITTYFTKRSEVYFYLISIVSRTCLPSWYLILDTLYNNIFHILLIQRKFHVTLTGK